MKKTVDVEALPEFDPAKYLDSEESIAVYLTGILEGNDAALLASALGDIARARGMTEIAKAAGITREALIGPCVPTARRGSKRSAASARRSACGWWLSRSLQEKLRREGRTSPGSSLLRQKARRHSLNHSSAWSRVLSRPHLPG